MDLEVLRREIELMVCDLRSALRCSGGREELERLLRGERLRVMPDAERGFAVEGELFWLLGAGAAPGPGGRCDSVVAGTRYARNAAALAGVPRLVIRFAG